MKKKSAALLAVLCALLSGCSLGGSGDKMPISVPYEEMIKPKTASAKTETVTGQANAAAPSEEAPSEGAPAASVNSTSHASPTNTANSARSPSAEKSEIKSKTAEAQSPKQSASSVQGSSQTAAESKPAAAQKAARAETSNSQNPQNPQSTAPIRMPTGANATGKDPAAVALGGVCYLPYKVPEPPAEESKPSTDSGTESGSESDTTSGSYKKPVKAPTKYDYGYRVVFRTSSETYLLGVTPYKNCTWDDLNSVCLEVGEKLETECEVVGAPSFEDLKMFTEAGIYFPEKHEFWTSTLTAEKGHKAYYRSSNGTFNSTKSTSLTSGACVMIKVKTSQSNSELLSNSRPNFDALKAQLEKEAADFKEAQSKSNSNANNSQ